MVCKKCGTRIAGDLLKCPECGNALTDEKEVIIPKQPEDEDFEEDLYDEEEEYLEDEDWEEFHLDKPKTAKQKSRRLVLSIAMLSTAIILVIAGIVVFSIFLMGSSSYSSQMENAEKEWKKGDYEQAIVSFENAVNKAGNNKDRLNALCRLAALYVEYGDDNSAIYYYEEAVSVGKISNEAVKALVELYENKGDTKAIRKLAENYGNEETDSLFEKYLQNQPIFNYKSGTYNELLTVEISTAGNEQIFYTLDGSDATPESTPYTEPLQIGEGTTEVHAVAVNSAGALSDEIITTYRVKLEVPSGPVISPETGNYADTTKITFYNIPTNCKAYYTIDGTVPTAESTEYTGPFDMMLGNHVIMAVCINIYTGQSSPVELRIYDLNVSGKISYAEAPGRVMNRLQDIGEVQDGDGTVLLSVTVKQIGSNKYYIVKRYQQSASGMKELEQAYAVDVNSGAVYRAHNNGRDEYNLSGL